MADTISSLSLRPKSRHLNHTRETFMNRRDFMQCMGIGALATSLPVAIAACTPNAGTDPGTDTGTAETSSSSPDKTDPVGKFIAIGTLAELNQKGYLSNTDAFAEPVLAIQNPTTPDAIIALSAKCPHNGCDVAWQEDLFACPCHGSKFNPDGTVVEGPATKALKPFSAKIENDTVLVAKHQT